MRIRLTEILPDGSASIGEVLGSFRDAQGARSHLEHCGLKIVGFYGQPWEPNKAGDVWLLVRKHPQKASKPRFSIFEEEPHHDAH